MKAEIIPASSRGHANHGWLNTFHSFSFAGYYNPERMHFGVLRVLNDDTVAPGMGFSKHPHDNMEIISIPLEGALEHHDSMGNTFVIKKNDVQVMSAGTGIFHSEKNRSKEEEVRFLQIWVFPKSRELSPRYSQLSFKPEDRINRLQQIVSPNEADEGVWIHQDAWLYLSDLKAGHSVEHQVKKSGNGLYLFVLEGTVLVEGHQLNRRDAIGITEAEAVKISAEADAEFLLMDVPMNI
ncbi:pirin family protein [bacterium]|nr:pirin family protein [bacterium]